MFEQFIKGAYYIEYEYIYIYAYNNMSRETADLTYERSTAGRELYNGRRLIQAKTKSREIGLFSGFQKYI